MRTTLLLVPVLLAGCVSPLADNVARNAAKSAVNPIIANRFPGIPLEPATDCVIDNASAGEIITLAQSAGAGGVSADATRIVLDIVSRPATIQCLATDGLPVLLQTL